MQFQNRTEAGKALAQRLGAYADRSDVIVLALPRGGVPVAFEVALSLGAPLDVIVVRKLGFPGHEELAMGAIASGGACVLNPEVISGLGRDVESVLRRAIDLESDELKRRERLYRGDRPFPNLRGRTVILVDDGLATGATMRAAVRSVREQQPMQVVVAAPVAAAQTCRDFRAKEKIDDFVCVLAPRAFMAVGQFYEDFSQTSDKEVRELLARAENEKR